MERQRKLFADGITSNDTLDQAEQAYANSKADYEAAIASRRIQEKQLDYYRIAAPFDGIVGDIPVHVGDYVSSTTMLTTVDENKDLEAYIYIPTERAAKVRNGLERGDSGQQRQSGGDYVDRLCFARSGQRAAGDSCEGARAFDEPLRNDQLVTARVVWG